METLSTAAVVEQQSWDDYSEVTERHKEFRNFNALKSMDRKLAAEIQQIIADDRMGKETVRKMKKAFDQATDRLGWWQLSVKKLPAGTWSVQRLNHNLNVLLALREVILSSYLLDMRIEHG